MTTREVTWILNRTYLKKICKAHDVSITEEGVDELARLTTQILINSIESLKKQGKMELYRKHIEAKNLWS